MIPDGAGKHPKTVLLVVIPGKTLALSSCSAYQIGLETFPLVMLKEKDTEDPRPH